MVLRSVVRIEEEKCTGCGLCMPACAEGAIQIVNGKAKLISEKYCDGLGACLGECPAGALTMEKREAEKFDEEAVGEHLKRNRLAPTVNKFHQVPSSCPSARVTRFGKKMSDKKVNIREHKASKLSHWPVQLALLPQNAPFFENADLLIVADCVPFAYADFHADFLKGKTLVIGCPKLDDAEFYKNKLFEVFRRNTIKSVTVVNMEVPCCFSLFRLVKEALDSSGKRIPIKQETITIKGEKNSADSLHALSLNSARSVGKPDIG